MKSSQPFYLRARACSLRFTIGPGFERLLEVFRLCTRYGAFRPGHCRFFGPVHRDERSLRRASGESEVARTVSEPLLALAATARGRRQRQDA